MEYKLWQIKGILKGFEQMGIIVDKLDENKKTLYLSIPIIKDGNGDEIAPIKTAEKIKAVFNGINIKYREI